MTIRNPNFGKWDRSDDVRYHKGLARPCLDAKVEEEARKEREHPCVTYFVDPQTLKEDKR